MLNRSPWRGVYAITPDIADTAVLLARTRALLTAGPALLQYRNKTAAAALRRAQATALRAACQTAAVPLIINDDVDLAIELGVGVHVGEDDADPAALRRQLGPTAIIGVSCYDSLPRAADAAAAGASYLAFGAFYPTDSKATTRRATPDLLAAAARFGLPRVAIGGIRPAHVPALVAAGADLVAVISGLYAADDPAAALRAYRAAFTD